jgi:hypothetical protein
MADHSSYPDHTDLSAFLAAHNLSVTALDTGTLADAAAAGVDAVERRCGRTFLATSQTRAFDPPGNPNGVMDTRDDLAAVTAISYQGTAMAAGTDYRAEPYDALSKGQPYNRIRFVKRLWYWPIDDTLRASISVQGLWGYGSTIPPAVWSAMLAEAGLSLMPELAHALAAGMVRWTEADVTEEYGAKPLAYLAGYWGQISARAERFRRVTVGLGF